MHLKQEERGDRGEKVGVIAGLVFVNTSAPAGMEASCWRDRNWTSVGGALWWLLPSASFVCFFLVNHIPC